MVEEFVGEDGKGGLREWLWPEKMGRKHKFVFFNTRGTPFSTGGWASWIQRIFVERTGQRISNNLLRDSFVTYAYSQGISDRLKQSVAAHMGHLPETAARHYDRRTSMARRQEGVAYAMQLVGDSETEESEAESMDAESEQEEEEEMDMPPPPEDHDVPSPGFDMPPPEDDLPDEREESSGEEEEEQVVAYPMESGEDTEQDMQEKHAFSSESDSSRREEVEDAPSPPPIQGPFKLVDNEPPTESSSDSSEQDDSDKGGRTTPNTEDEVDCLLWGHMRERALERVRQKRRMRLVAKEPVRRRLVSQ